LGVRLLGLLLLLVLLFEELLGAGLGVLAPDLVDLCALHVVEEGVQQEELCVNPATKSVTTWFAIYNRSSEARANLEDVVRRTDLAPLVVLAVFLLTLALPVVIACGRECPTLHAARDANAPLDDGRPQVVARDVCALQGDDACLREWIV
jgi:hypothetical protein